MTAGILSAYNKDFDTALKDYATAMRMVEFISHHERDILSCILARNQATIIGLSGNQQGALRRLHCLSPAARSVARLHPAFGLEYLNALANELFETGEIESAQRIISIPTASSLVARFPEWIESRIAIESKLKRPNRSTVVITGNPLRPPSPVEQRKRFRLLSPTPQECIPPSFDSTVSKARPTGNSERLNVVANLVEALICRGATENVLKLLNRILEARPSQDLITRLTNLIERDGGPTTKKQSM